MTDEPGDLPAGFRIDPMVDADVEEVAAVERRSYTTPWSARAFRHEIGRNPYARNYVMRDRRGRLAAYASLWTLDDQMLLNNLTVAPEFRSRGVGAALLRHLLSVAGSCGCREIHLEVRPSNDHARRLYARHGFQQVGVRRRYYSDGEDALLLRRQLPGVP